MDEDRVLRKTALNKNKLVKKWGFMKLRIGNLQK